MDPTRRWLLHRSIELTALALIGCSGKEEPGDSDEAGTDSAPTDSEPGVSGDDTAPTGPGGTDSTAPGDDTTAVADDTGSPPDTGPLDTGEACPDPLEGAEYLGVVAFVGETPRDLESLIGDGLDGRYVHDLSTLSAETLITPTDRFFIRTSEPDLIDVSGWSVRLEGEVAASVLVSAEALIKEAVDQGVIHMECSGNTSYGGFGLMSACEWQGVPLSSVLARVKPTSRAALIRITGFDEHSSPSSSVEGAAWIFTPAQLERAFLATAMNGAPLTPDHGYPLRLMVPGWYGCACVKWVESIEWVEEDAAATTQMQEFADRTHQPGVPALARDYIDASIDTTALPVRVEKYRLDGRIVYKVVGLTYGADLTDRLQIRFGEGSWEDVTVCPARESALTWGLWAHVWEPSGTGDFTIRLRVDDSAVQTRRLDSEWYRREVTIDET